MLGEIRCTTVAAACESGGRTDTEDVHTEADGPAGTAAAESGRSDSAGSDALSFLRCLAFMLRLCPFLGASPKVGGTVLPACSLPSIVEPSARFRLKCSDAVMFGMMIYLRVCIQRNNNK